MTSLSCLTAISNADLKELLNFTMSCIMRTSGSNKIVEGYTSHASCTSSLAEHRGGPINQTWLFLTTNSLATL